jgi:hypothetical protein
MTQISTQDIDKLTNHYKKIYSLDSRLPDRVIANNVRIHEAIDNFAHLIKQELAK